MFFNMKGVLRDLLRDYLLRYISLGCYLQMLLKMKAITSLSQKKQKKKTHLKKNQSII